MWQTSTGNRTLQGAEARLVADAIDVMIDDLDEYFVVPDSPPPWQFGISVFDNLSPSQQLAVLHAVATHLLVETEEPLPLSATNEGAVGAIFEEIRDQIIMEIETSRSEIVESHSVADDMAADAAAFRRASDFARMTPSWRQRVLDAFAATQQGDDGDGDEWLDEWEEDDLLPRSAFDRDITRWEMLIESLADAILWDRDYEMAESFLDAAPDLARQRRELLGIDDEYYIAIAPDPPAHEIPRLLGWTRSIVRRRPR